jgi:hypothetical protein
MPRSTHRSCIRPHIPWLELRIAVVIFDLRCLRPPGRFRRSPGGFHQTPIADQHRRFGIRGPGRLDAGQLLQQHFVALCHKVDHFTRLACSSRSAHTMEIKLHVSGQISIHHPLETLNMQAS